MYKKDDTILVVTNRTGYIPQMRMCGPIIQPISIPVSLCLSMVCSGVELYEVDPITKTNVKLTPQNIMDDTKFAPVAVDIVMSENDKDEVKKEVESPVTNAEVLPPVASEAAIITSDNVVETSEETTEAKTTEQAQSKKNKNKNKNK